MGKNLLKVILFFLLSNLYSQKLYFNRNSVQLNEFLELNVTLESENITKISVFPELKGFEKHDSSLTAHSFIMQYKPLQPGKYQTPAIKITVNQKKLSLAPFTIQVSATSHFSNFFKEEEKKVITRLEDKVSYTKETLDFTPKEDLFMTVNYNKKEVYVGEAFYANISLYLLEKKADKYDFVDFEVYYDKLTKSFKPFNCLEENIPIDKIESEFVSISGQKYLKYKLYESVFYPLNAQELTFKSASLPMLKSKLMGLKKDTIVVQSLQKAFKVKKLPIELQGENINVGKFGLSEAISNHHVTVGQSINYTFKISGEGNISNLTKPIIENSDRGLEIYESKIIISTKKEDGKITGDVSFHYHITALRSGRLSLKDYIRWTYFDPSTGKTDTLLSRISVNAKGDYASNQMISSNQTDGFYKIIESQNNKLRNADSNDQFKKWANIGFIIMLSFTLLFVFKGSNNKSRQ